MFNCSVVVLDARVCWQWSNDLGYVLFLVCFFFYDRKPHGANFKRSLDMMRHCEVLF